MLAVSLVLTSLAATAAAAALPPNGSFESALTGWTGERAALAIRSGGMSGSHYARATRRSGAAFGLHSVLMDGFAQDDTVSVRAWVRAKAGIKVCLRLRERDGGGALVRQASSCRQATGRWQRPAASLLVVASGHRVAAGVVEYRRVAGATLDVDGVVVTRSSPSPTADLYVSTAGSDGSCRRGDAAEPCKSFDRAYALAQPGDVVEVAGGTFPGQSIDLIQSRTGTVPVVFRPAAGADVTFSGELLIDAGSLELRDMTFVWQVLEHARDVVLRRIHAHGAPFVRSDGTDAPVNISILGGEIGPSDDETPRVASNGFSTSASPRNVLFDGVLFHDVVNTGPSDHVDCLQVWAADGLTIRNSRFRNCWAFDILILDLGGNAGTPTNVLIENNFLNCCGAGSNYAIRLSDTDSKTSWKDVTIRFNSADDPINLGPGAPYSNVKVIGNIAPRIDGEPSGATIDYNVWYSGSKVGSHDVVAGSGYVNPAVYDFHLKAGAAARNRVPTAVGGPAFDIDGDARPAGSAYDAGADEAG